MPARTFHIFIAFDDSDIKTADGLYRYLNQALEGEQLVFWNPSDIAEEAFRTKANTFLEKTDLFIACLSANYLDTPNARWALEKALSEQKRRPEFQILVVLARAAFVPSALAGFTLAPAPDQPVEGFPLSRDIQLQRAAQRARDLLLDIDRRADLFPVPEGPAFVLTFEDVRERLQVWLEHCDLAPLFLFLKRLLHPERTPDDLFQLEDAFAEWRQQAQRNKLEFNVFEKTMDAIRLDLGHLIGRLEESRFRKNWPGIFADTYYAWSPVAPPADQLAGLFLPTGEIHTPETLNLPKQTRNNEAWEGAGTLSHQQQQEFRRNLLLAQDALGIGNFARAHALCEHVRTHVDPQSAQLYELLLITYLKKETPDRIIHDAVYGKGSKLNHVVVYAGRYIEYQQNNQCPSEDGQYNLQATAQALSDALLRLYSTYENDFILHTGRHSAAVPDNRTAVSNCVQVAMAIYRTIHPYRGFLELAVNELCNGAKYDYIRRVEIVNDEFRFASHEDFGIESEIREVIGMLEAVSNDDDDALMNRQLRENLFFNLRAKRFRLQAQIAEEQRRYVQFTDLRDSVIELVDAALLGYKIFGDKDYPDEESFLRLAVEQLLPGLLLPTASAAPTQAVGHLRWFDLDALGNVRTHPDCARFQFDALAVVEKIARDHAGHTGWLQVQPNIKEEVYRQFAADADLRYQHIRDELQWTDIRRPNETEARNTIVQCLRDWKSAYLAYPGTRRILPPAHLAGTCRRAPAAVDALLPYPTDYSAGKPGLRLRCRGRTARGTGFALRNSARAGVQNAGPQLILPAYPTGVSKTPGRRRVAPNRSHRAAPAGPACFSRPLPCPGIPRPRF
ncbi:MAG: toll/interleukin-1 receptor domain-containing protein [Lewinellaceae bacterium]|nr:toll/interleukin-1 receptor domain-containing protein [Lewinellaceae bacterium]